MAISDSENDTNREEEQENQIFITLASSQIKACEILKGEILLDMKQPLSRGCAVLLSLECKQRVLKKDIIIFEKEDMCMQSEIYRIQPSSLTAKMPGTYKIPFEVKISEIFEPSECFKLNNDYIFKVSYELKSFVAYLSNNPSQQQQTILRDKDNLKQQDRKQSNDCQEMNKIQNDIEQKIEILFSSAPVSLEIINPLLAKKSQPIIVSQKLPQRQRSFFKSIGTLFCCSSTQNSKDVLGPSDDSAQMVSKKMDGGCVTKQSSELQSVSKQQENIKQLKEKKETLSRISQFTVNVDTINLYPGESLLFEVNDDSKKSQIMQYNCRLICKKELCGQSETKEPLLFSEESVIYEKVVNKGVSGKVLMAYHLQSSYSSNIFNNSYELHIVPQGFLYSDNLCIKLPIHVNQKQFRLIPLHKESMDDDISEEGMRQNKLKRLSSNGKVIAKISLKFDEIPDENPSQKSTKLNSPHITPISR